MAITITNGVSTDEYRTVAEAYIDGWNLANAIGELAEICSAKADHVRTNWQDDELARLWERAASILQTAEARPAVRSLSR